ncbi:hypothetical protein N7454_005494 [Penicillium verhagenii]|nr:hypothetical protein N7454_005494 [Penicillium verhagenii]
MSSPPPSAGPQASETEKQDVTTSITPIQDQEPTSLLSEIRKYPKISAYAIGLALAFLLTGYDTVILGTITAVPYFKYQFGELYADAYIIPSAWLSVWSAIQPIGAMIGAAAAGWFQDRAGRRQSLGLSCVICAIGIAIAFCSNLPAAMASRRGTFLVGRFVQGLGVGGSMAGAQTYLSETVPVSLRGSAMALSPTFMLLGELIGALVIWGCEHRTTSTAFLIPFGTQWITAVLPFLVAVFMPESPAYLLRSQEYEKASRAMAALHTDRVDTVPMLEQMRLSIIQEEQVSAELSYIDCFTGTNRRRTMITAFAFMVPSLFGVPLLSSASYFMQTVGMSASLSIVVLIIGIVLGLLANAVGVWLMSRFGRRPLMLATLAASAIIYLSMGIAGCWSGHIVVWYTAVSLIVVVIVCGLGAWPASYAITGEASSLRLRAMTQGIGVLCYMLSNVVLSLILPYIYNTDEGDLKGKTGFVYAGLCVIACAATWAIVPEMKGRSALEIDAMFEAGLPCRQFESWSNDGGSIDGEKV